MSRRPPLAGLYVLTPQALCDAPHALIPAVAKALKGGAKWLQYRDKQLPAAQRRRDAQQLLQLCREHGAGLIINDDVELCEQIDADGVHLGLDDLPLAEARAVLGPQKIIGITCGDSLARAQQASDGGADYLALGSFFASRTKPQARPVSLDHLIDVRRRFSLPLCAIGGITAERAPALIQAGADLIAVSEAVFAGDQVQAQAQALARCFLPS